MHEHPGGIGAELGAQAASAPFPLAGVVIGGGLLLVLVAYAARVRAGRRRGRAWSDARTLSAAAGVVAGVVAVGPLGVLGHHDFTAHMWGHLLLGMLAPLLLVLSAPVTVALRGLPVAWARRLSRVLSTPYVRVVSHPVVAGLLNIGGLWLLYTTPLHAWMHASAVGHLLVHVHVLLAGWVFTAAILQVDPAPHPHGHPLRAGVLVAFLALHAILSKHVYAHPPAGVGVAEAQAGAQLMYYGGDWIDLVLIAVFCLDWYRRTAPVRSGRCGGPGGVLRRPLDVLRTASS